MCTHTMHTGLITLANVIHSLMNMLHTPDMEPTSVRNKPEYLSTAAGCKPWRIEHVFPDPAWSFVRIINFWKTWFRAGSIYVHIHLVILLWKSDNGTGAHSFYSCNCNLKSKLFIFDRTIYIAFSSYIMYAYWENQLTRVGLTQSMLPPSSFMSLILHSWKIYQPGLKDLSVWFERFISLVWMCS